MNTSVVILAFSDARQDLKYLEEENDGIQRALKLVKDCSIRSIEKANTEKIVQQFDSSEVFDRFITVFHYAGHSDAFNLVFNDRNVHSVDFAGFLCNYPGLSLVFLNGCSNAEQVKALLDAGVKAIIATSTNIDDKSASDFAVQFYKHLANGASIRKAFDAAQSFKKFRGGKNRKASTTLNTDDVAPGDFPWKLYPEKNHHHTDWRLSDGNVPLPVRNEDRKPVAPYKSLASFTSDDAEIFFGRKAQILDLYNHAINRRGPNIVFVYGQSGVGKSSLLEAGLIPILKNNSDVFYFTGYKRIEQFLDEITRFKMKYEDSKKPFNPWDFFESTKRGVKVIIFDQIEEIVKSKDVRFRKDLLQILALALKNARNSNGKVILGFKKEVLADVTDQIESILTLLNSDSPIENPASLFLKPLSKEDVIEAIKGPIDSPNLNSQWNLAIKNEDLNDDLAERIANAITDDIDSPIAPNLQILLSKMWSEAKNANPAAPEFNRKLYDSLNEKYLYLDTFLDESLKQIQQEMQESINNIYDTGLAVDILLQFVSDEEFSSKEIDFEGIIKKYPDKQDILKNFLELAIRNHLLVDGQPFNGAKEQIRTIRLSHDTLANVIVRESRKVKYKGPRAIRLIKYHLLELNAQDDDVWLDERDLEIIEEGLQYTRDLTLDERELLEKSRKKKKETEHERNKIERIFAAKEGLQTLKQQISDLLEQQQSIIDGISDSK
jgi:hypothetical protein